ncbi:MAG TPA: cell division protein ZipA [Gammaproteobacteria bacterium]|nr:cell division protein ZipA [Gammaproteobacteria bacterium]
MSSLRLYLLGIGIVILLVIYFFGRKREEDDSHDVFADISATHSDPLLKDEPSQESPSLPEAAEPDQFVGDMDLVPDLEPIEPEAVIQENWQESEFSLQPEELEPLSADYDGLGAEAEVVPIIDESPEPASPPLQLVIMYVVAPEGQAFPGEAVLKAFHAHKLRFGALDIYHRFTNSSSDAQVVFSISNMHEPGTLKPSDLVTAEISGLSFFMKVPAPNNARVAYDDMLHVAQHLASTLGGSLYDDGMELLDNDTISHLRSQLARA